MTTINLLPWRIIQRKKQNQVFWLLNGIICFLLIIICIVIHYHFKYMYQKAYQTHDALQQKVNQL